MLMLFCDAISVYPMDGIRGAVFLDQLFAAGL